MKKINTYEYSDLSKEAKEKAFADSLELTVENDLETLNLDLNAGVITEKDYYEQLGCSKYYAETTGWFVPSCYYDKNKKMLDEQVKLHLEEYCLFSKEGKFIANK